MKTTLDDIEIRIAGIEALYKELGPAAAMRFLTLEEIFERAKKRWKQ